ncbi:hypothetical protein TNCV_2050461 [Trichonephila clavipes]|nr:hypothetical protein TNCV_2050461 [Trichonephila clavipes]
MANLNKLSPADIAKLIEASNSEQVSDLHAEIVEVEIDVMSPSIVPSGNFAELNRTVTCMVLKANDRRTSCPCHDEFRGPRSDYVRQVALENNNNKHIILHGRDLNVAPNVI